MTSPARRRLPTTIPVLAVAGNLLVTRRRDRLPPEQVAELQAQLLRNLVRYAHTNVPYYRDNLDPAAVARLRGPADLVTLPTLDRQTLSELGPAPLLADGFDADNTRSSQTSGSTGFPVTLHYSERELGYLRASFLWDMIACGLRPTDRIGFVRLGAFRRHRLERLGLVRNIHIGTRMSLDEQVEVFLRGRPTFLAGLPNPINALVGELKRRGITYRGVRVVQFGGESLADAARAEVLDYFDAVGTEIYASVEAYTIARTCPQGALHLRSGEVVVEVEHDDGTVSVADGEGEILVTRLHAEAMPLLRYRLGDRVRIEPNDCPCRVVHTPVVRRILGRVMDQLVTRDGRSRNGDYLSSVVEGVPGVRRLQVLHSAPGVVELLVVPTADAPADLAASVAHAVKSIESDYHITVTITDHIVPEPSGKIRLVKRLW